MFLNLAKFSEQSFFRNLRGFSDENLVLITSLIFLDFDIYFYVLHLLCCFKVRYTLHKFSHYFDELCFSVGPA